ncbi:hypothetical protein [Pseudorhodoferax sp. Leaf274]|uniref:hypothetical protein n=1 Tax=Pseudorhodoferax sp. Leaf274 TaxID=1736318 RepID=UPI00070324A2|nr:hypothetical protein [Pseudorhodoferax sp. Leaf274]KQP37587.1 hypothetical protein ASF44_14690 [Pseudorhodoferax sp. Leaf274]
MLKQSTIQQRGAVTFPEFTGERVYMLPFRKAEGLPFDLARWQPTVDAMLDGIDVASPIYLMIDQGVVQPGATHRRPGVHIDGYWRPEIAAHGQPAPRPGHGHQPPEPWRPHVFTSSWDHQPPGPTWVYAGSHGQHVTSRRQREAIILASSVQGGAAWVGQYDGEPGEGGDFSHLDLASLAEVPMGAGFVWAGDAMTTLHASVPLARATPRTLVRLNVPGWVPT